MNYSRFFAALLLAWPLTVAAQSTPATQQVTEVTEDLDPATGKVIRRTTRTFSVPAGEAAPATAATPEPEPEPAPPAVTAPTRTSAPARASAPTRSTTPAPTTAKAPAPTKGATSAPASRPLPASSAAPTTAAAPTSDAQASAFFRRKITVAALTGPGLLEAYTRFGDTVRRDRHNWKAADWTTAAAVLTTLNTRYEQLRSSMSLDDKLTIRTEQAEFQALRTARQVSDQVSDKF